MKKNKPEKSVLAARLSAYTASTGALLLLAHNASSQVTYSGTQNLELQIPEGFLELDLNDDGIMDFAFLMQGYSDFSSYGGYYYNIDFAYGVILNPRSDTYNSWITRIDTVRSYPTYYGSYYFLEEPIVNGLEAGEPASCDEEYWAHRSDVSWSAVMGVAMMNTYSGPYGGYSTSFSAGDFIADEKFIGVRFHIGEDQHYGWIRCSMDAAIETLTIVDWAYESTPDKVIQAGAGLGMDLPPWLQISGAESGSEPLTAITISATEEVTGLEATDITITNGTASNFTEVTAGLEYTLDVTATAEGEVRLDIPEGAVTDLTGNDNPAVSRGWLYDLTGPETMISLYGPTYTGYPYMGGNISFSESVTELDGEKLVVTNGELTYFDEDYPPGSYFFEVYAYVEGEVSLQVMEGAVTDQGGNPNSEATITWHYDASPPVADLSVGFSSTTEAEVDVNINFSEPVHDLEEGDFQISNGYYDELIPGETETSFILEVFATGTGIVMVELPAESVWDNAYHGNEHATVAWLYDPMSIDKEEEQKVLVFPNPASEYIQIKSDREVNLAVFDAQGNLILSRENVMEESISVSDLSKGMYIIRIQDKEESWYQKILIQ